MRDGSLTRVELTCGGERYLVERVEEGVGRVVEAPRLPEHHVPLRVPPLRGLLAQELEFLGRDRIFEAARRWTLPGSQAPRRASMDVRVRGSTPLGSAS